MIFDEFTFCKVSGGGFCENLAYFNGARYLWYIYIVVLFFSLLICGLYGAFICKNNPDLKYIIKWHAGIFIVNITTLYWIPVLLLNFFCGISTSCGFYFGGIPLLVGSLFLTFLDILLSPDARYFKNMTQTHIEETSKFLARVKESKPSIIVNLKCYHHEMVLRQSQHSNRIRSRNVERVTFSESRHFPFDSFVDNTLIPSTEGSTITLFQMSKSITAGDAHSQDQFQQFQNRYIQANRHRDQFVKLEVDLAVPGIVEADRMILGLFRLNDERVMTIRGSQPWWTQREWFYILSFFSISIVLRMMFRTRSKEYSLLVDKKFFVDPNIARTYDFDTGVVPPMANTYAMAPQQGYGQPQYTAGSYMQPQQLYPAPPHTFQQGGVVYVPAQQQGGVVYAPAQHQGGVVYASVPVPAQFGQPATVPVPQENMPFINTQVNPDAPPDYSQQHNFKTVS